MFAKPVREALVQPTSPTCRHWRRRDNSILDALKGAAAVLIASIFFTGVDSVWWIGAAGLIAILGHIFPIWLGFRGGKGVATGVGVFAVLTPFAVFCSAVAFVRDLYGYALRLASLDHRSIDAASLCFDLRLI